MATQSNKSWSQDSLRLQLIVDRFVDFAKGTVDKAGEPVTLNGLRWYLWTDLYDKDKKKSASCGDN
jgi:hypothetical protein